MSQFVFKQLCNLCPGALGADSTYQCSKESKLMKWITVTMLIGLFWGWGWLKTSLRVMVTDLSNISLSWPCICFSSALFISSCHHWLEIFTSVCKWHSWRSLLSFIHPSYSVPPEFFHCLSIHLPVQAQYMVLMTSTKRARWALTSKLDTQLLALSSLHASWL